MSKVRLRPLLLSLLLPLAYSADAISAKTETIRLAVGSPAQIVRDEDGVPHIFANTEADLAYLQGYVHARDRLFQMDALRRQAAGTLAELLGSTALASDVQLRTFGIRRAAERSLPVLSAPTRAALKAYSAGVNAYVSKNALPPEYAAIEVTQFKPWTEVDSISVLKLVAFQLAFDINDLQQTLTLRSYQAAGVSRGFDGAALFAEDLVRLAPFEKAAIIPDAMQAPVRPPKFGRFARPDASFLHSSALQMARTFLDDVQRAPFAADAIKSRDDERGSNSYVVSGRFSASGEPLIAGDQHLSLTAPAPWYDMQLQSKSAGIDVVGASFPGAPFIILGSNNRIAWNATNHQLDVTDIYQERIVADPTSPSGFSTMYKGSLEHVIPLPQVFRANQLSDGKLDNIVDVPAGGAIPAAVLIVPRRNQGPIIQLSPADGIALSLQFAGSSGTRELDAFRGFGLARNIEEFKRALRFFDVGSQNFMYADVDGNIAHFVSGEAPLREDLQAGKVAGLSPLFIRNGQGGNEWLEATTVDPNRSLPYEILPMDEMPRIVNPPRGFIVSANNDPTGALQDNDALNQLRPGGGIFYLGGTYTEGIRAKRADQLIEERIRQRGRLTTQDLKDVQADTVMLDARFFTPRILAAFDNAGKPGAHPMLAQLAADPRVGAAIGRLAAWDQSTPTGIRLGYDSNDTAAVRREPSATEIGHSVAATIYSVWRNQFLSSTIVSALRSRELPVFNTGNRRELITAMRTLFDRFDERKGVGLSGVNFFEVPGIDDAATRRDVVVLRSLAMALDKLAGNEYAAAFGRSTNQGDYRWGMLHRVILDHPFRALFPEFSIPSANGAFPAPLGPNLPGIPVDGGFLTVDVSNNDLMDDSASGFLFRFGATRRYVGRARIFGSGFDLETSLPGGQSGAPGSPFYINLLEEWLVNETHPLRASAVELLRDIAAVDLVLPERK
jgi:penicillin amidase